MARRLETLTDDQLLAEWGTAADRIKNDVLDLFWSQKLLEDLRAVFLANQRLQDTGGFMWEWVRTSHAYATLMRLRREVDTQSNTVNLLQLLFEIKARPAVFTRREIVDRAGSDERLAKILTRAFDNDWQPVRHSSDSALDHINPAVIDGDIAALLGATEAVSEFASRTVAHRPWVQPGTLTFESVEAAVGAVGETFRKYYVLVKGVWLASLTPTAQYDTHELYTFLWKPR